MDSRLDNFDLAFYTRHRVKTLICRKLVFQLPLIITLFVLIIPIQSGWPALSGQVVHYEIEASLDTLDHSITGHETIRWLNTSTDRVPDLWFHLYMNAFKNEKSTFWKESGGRGRMGRLKAEKWGYIDLRKITLTDGTDLKPTMKYQHPDDNNPDDETVASVQLPKPVPPNGEITIILDFYVRLPEVVARTGYKRNFFFAGQWFPKLGVYEKTEMRGRTIGDRATGGKGGWNCHQFHRNSEFYADYGSYKVHLTVPEQYIVGATGARIAETQDAQKKTKTYTYYQEDVHDFAWTASPQFVVVPDEHIFPGGHKVKITLLTQKDYVKMNKRILDATHNGLKWFGAWYGEYPYKTLTVVIPPVGGYQAGGMEYPTLFTGIAVRPAHWRLFRDIHFLIEETIIHEFGHQYWYGLVGSNEFEESWLDEGFNSYSTGRVMAQVYSESASLGLFLKAPLSELEFARWHVVTQKPYSPVKTPAWKFYGGGEYGTHSYSKPQILLGTLENYLGLELFQKIMRTYYERWRFKHPTTEDFIAVANEVAGQNLDWFFKQFIYGTQTVDYEISVLESKEQLTKRGIYDSKTKPGEKEVVTEQKPKAKNGSKEKKDKAKKTYESEVRVHRIGDGYFPVEIEIKFEKEKVKRYKWDGQTRWVSYKFLGPHKLEYAVVDPNNKVLLDVNRLNNSRTSQKQSRAINTWSTRWLFVMQNFLQNLTVF